VLIMTSNIGSMVIQEAMIGGKEMTKEDREEVMSLMRQQFRPEFLNRVDEMIVFHPLGKEQLTLIVDVQMRHLRHRLADRRMSLDITPAALQQLADEGYDPAFGARPLKRVIQQRLENPIASQILRGQYGDGDAIHVDADGAKHDFTFTKGAKSAEVAEGELVEH